MSRMKRCIILAAALFSGAFASHAAIYSTFDIDLEGWTKNGDASSTFEWRADAGREGGGLYWRDAAISAGDNIFAPAKFLGDISVYDTFSFDLRRGNDATQAPLEVTFSSTGGSVLVDFGLDYDSTWQTYVIDLESQVFPLVDETSITSIKIKIDLVTGTDISYVDNVSLVPEPQYFSMATGLGIFTIAMLCLRRRQA